MKSQHLKTLLKFLKTHKQINKTNVTLLDKEITEDKIYELRAYTEGKLSHLSFGHSIKGWTDQNGVIITNSKVRKPPKDETMSNSWNNGNNNVIIALNKKIDDNHTAVNNKIDKVHFELNKKIDNNIASVNKKIDDVKNEIKADINQLTNAIKELTVSLTKHINDHSTNN